jgi:hypothetical protein
MMLLKWLVVQPIVFRLFHRSKYIFWFFFDGRTCPLLNFKYYNLFPNFIWMADFFWWASFMLIELNLWVDHRALSDMTIVGTVYLNYMVWFHAIMQNLVSCEIFTYHCVFSLHTLNDIILHGTSNYVDILQLEMAIWELVFVLRIHLAKMRI